jgi:hypothetical protein
MAMLLLELDDEPTAKQGKKKGAKKKRKPKPPQPKKPTPAPSKHKSAAKTLPEEEDSGVEEVYALTCFDMLYYSHPYNPFCFLPLFYQP